MNAFLLLAIMNAACIALVIVTILKKRTAPKSNAPVVVSDH
jgi:spore maturation protein SpmA